MEYGIKNGLLDLTAMESTLILTYWYVFNLCMVCLHIATIWITSVYEEWPSLWIAWIFVVIIFFVHVRLQGYKKISYFRNVSLKNSQITKKIRMRMRPMIDTINDFERKRCRWFRNLLCKSKCIVLNSGNKPYDIFETITLDQKKDIALREDAILFGRSRNINEKIKVEILLLISKYLKFVENDSFMLPKKAN